MRKRVPLAALPDSVTVAETADVLRLSCNKTYDAIRRGHLPAVRLGRRLVVPKAAIVQMLGGIAQPERRRKYSQPPILKSRSAAPSRSDLRLGR